MTFRYISDKFPDIKLFVDQWIIDSLVKCRENNDPKNRAVVTEGKLPILFENKDDEERMMIDYIITLGGDGTILWAAKQFYKNYVPPLISFAHGSLGYLCNYTFDEHPEVLSSILCSTCKAHLDERLRLRL